METKTVLVLLLCLVIISGAAYLNIRKRERKGQHEEE